MPKYRVTLAYLCTVTIDDVEAETPDDAMDTVYQHDHMPGGLSYRAFNENTTGGAPSVDGGEWTVVTVEDDETGAVLLDGAVVFGEPVAP